MANEINFGVILAAGSAVRLQPLSKYFPKLTLPVFDNPLIVHHFNIMKCVGVKKVFIVVSDYNFDVISTILNKVDDINIEYEFVKQNVPNGTGHALWLLKDYLVSSRFLMLLGDEYYNDIGSFSKLKEIDTNDNILGIVEYNDVKNIMTGCNVLYNGEHIQQLIEKPKQAEIKDKWCWDGSVVLNSQIFEILDEMCDEFEQGIIDQICIVRAMQSMLDLNISIKYFKKYCGNINITYDIDLIKASFIECSKKYDRDFLLSILSGL